MAEVAILKSELDSALDLSVKCSRIALHRTSSNEDSGDRDIVEDSDNAFLQGPTRKRLSVSPVPLHPPPPLSGHGLRHDWQQAAIYRSESDSDSQFSPTYSPVQVPIMNGRNQGSPIDNPLRQNGCSVYTVEAGSPDKGMTFVQGQRIIAGYAQEMQELNGMMVSDEYMTPQQHQQHLTQTDIGHLDHVQRSYPDCIPFGFPFAGNIYSNRIAGSPLGAVSSRVASPSSHKSPNPCQSSFAPNIQGINGSAVQRTSPIFNPRKRFLAEIRKASGETSPSLEPNSTSAHLPPTSLSMEVPTPSSSEERNNGISRGNGGGFQEKDEAYWERRRKNNEAAKRSRDIRRQKEEQVAARAASLSAENVQLRAQIEVLKTQLALIQSMVINGAHRQS